MNKCRSKEARENRYSRRKRIQEEKITRNGKFEKEYLRKLERNW